MAPKDLYFLPQAFVMSKDGSKEEFAGITQFGLEYDNNMMYQALAQKTGIFKGNMGHPVPSKISEEQIPFYTKQMQVNENFLRLSHEVTADD